MRLREVDVAGERMREASLREGQLVVARWTWNYKRFSAPASVVRVNLKSIRVRLRENVDAGDGYFYQRDQCITLARVGRRGWSANNRVVVPED